MTALDWSLFDAALDRLAGSGRIARFWWRDDDAVAATPALDRLIARAELHGLDLLLAVIPRDVERSLARRLARHPCCMVAVHGWGHVNHAPPGEKKQELGAHRSCETVVGELRRGREKLSELFGERGSRVLVPPWNRIAPDVVAALPGAGFSGLSAYGTAPAAPPPGLRVVNVELDPIDWHGSRSLADPAALIGELARHVAGCAEGRRDVPLGVLTHHLAHDASVWGFVDALFARTCAHAACQWVHPDELFTRDAAAAKRS